MMNNTDIKKINKDNYENIVYISHGYGGKQENLDEINEIMKIVYKLHPNWLILNPVAMFSPLYNLTDYDKGLNMCLFLLNLSDEMWVVDENYRNSKGVIREIYYCDKFLIPYKLTSLKELNKLLDRKEEK